MIDNRTATDKLNKHLDEIMELNDLPGIAIGVSCSLDTGLEYTGARGFRDYENRTPLKADDIFHCASVSKLFTSSAIMKLVEAGAFSLYDRLCNILPHLKDGNTDFCGTSADSSAVPCIADWRFDEIRLWNMLTHTSGLGDCSDYEWASALTDDGALSRYVYGSYDSIGQPMLWCPQTGPEFYGVPDEENLFRYSNVAYEILGQIVAEYSDRMPDASGNISYEDFVARYLLEPAGMDNSTMKTFERDGWDSDVSVLRSCSGSMALPHIKDSDRSIKSAMYYPYNRMHAPSSTLTSNVSDLLKWGRAVMMSASGQDEMILQKETYDSVWRNYATVPNNGEKMGLGWFMRKQKAASGKNGSDRQYTLYGHEGTDDGFRASFWICPELELVTVVLSNLSNAPVKKINKKLFQFVEENLLG